MAWNPLWEDVYRLKSWGQYPPEKRGGRQFIKHLLIYGTRT